MVMRGRYGAAEVTAFLSALATRGRVASSTQNQALAALLFLYRAVLDRDVPWLDDVVRAKRSDRLPVVLSREEVGTVLSALDGERRLMATLLYGAGLRLLECLRLRVKDVDLARSQLVVRGGKGNRDRVTVLPRVCRAPLERHLDRVRAQHVRDVRQDAGWVELPYALARKSPHAGREWAGQWVFPRAADTVIPRRASAPAIFTRRSSSTPCARPRAAPASRSA